MDGNRDFTVSPDRFGGLPQYVKDLKARGVKFITILVSFIAHILDSISRSSHNKFVGFLLRILPLP